MALQDVLGGLQNPAASRNAILQRLGIDPNRAAGYGGNTQFDQRMADLYRQGLESAASYDTQEGDLNRGYSQDVAKNAVDKQRALELVKGNMAQRGLTFSGINEGEQNRTGSEYDNMLANLTANRDAGLTGIGRGRENLEYGIRAGQQAAEEGYGADLGAFLQQQAIDLWNSVVQQNQQNAMIQAMNRPAPAPAPARPAAPRPAAPAPAPVTPLRPPALKGQGYSSTGRGPF
jgi:hypothetical protein